MKKLCFLFLATLLTVGCPPPTPTPGGDENGGGNSTAPEVQISFSQAEMTLWKNTSSRLAVNVVTKAPEKGYTLTSSNEDIVKISLQTDGNPVITARNLPGTVTLTAVSKADKSAKATCTVTVPDGIQEVVHRGGKGFRLLSLFDFETTGLKGTWTYKDGTEAKFSREFSDGSLKITTISGADSTEANYSLDLQEGLVAGLALSGKNIAYAEVIAQVSAGADTGVAMGLGSADMAGDNNSRGWANEFIDTIDSVWKSRLANSRGNAYTIETGKDHAFGISFLDGSNLTAYTDGIENNSKAAGDYAIPNDGSVYYLYFGKTGNSSTTVTVSVDTVAFYYYDDSMEVIQVDDEGNIIETVTPPAPGMIPARIAVDGKILKLTHYDSFDSMDVLKENWDIGNPGIERPEIGNEGIASPTLVTFDDGIKGYSGDRYKQPYWSPKAVDIQNGELLIKVFFDKTIRNKNVNNGQEGWVPGSGGTYDTTGYGLAGAIHSKRQFPSGLFITKIKHSWGNRSSKTNAHWDAWWAESNNPFSRAYGEKELFMPEGGESRIRRAKNITTSDEYTDVPTSDRGLNGQQVYEYDMYEWVGNNQSQWQVLHSWAWYGGYPGWEDRYETRGGDNNYWSTSDNLRGRDNNGISGTFSNNYSDGGQASSGDWFYLAMLVTPEKVVMWNFPKTWNWDFSQSGTRKSQMNKTAGAFGNSDVTAPFMNADTYAPIQVKYSSELGDWGNMHNLIYDAKDQLTPENPDIMHAEFFAFYAWDTVKYTSVETDVAE